MKNLLYILLIFMTAHIAVGQEIYFNSEGIKVISFNKSTGVIYDFNPASDSINNSANSAQHVNNTTLYNFAKVLKE